MNIRAACTIIGQASGTPGVIRWAACLRRAKLIPRDGLTGRDIAKLLIAVAAAPNPKDAPDALTAVMDLTTSPPVRNGTLARINAVCPFIAPMLTASSDISTSLSLELFLRCHGSEDSRKPYELTIATCGGAARVVKPSCPDNVLTETVWGIWPGNPVSPQITGAMLNEIAAAVGADFMTANPAASVESHTLH